MRWTIGATDMGDALCPKLIYENKTEVTETPETIHNVLVNYGTPPSKITVWTVVTWFRVASVRDVRLSVFGLLVLCLRCLCCLPCVRCLALPCVALRSFRVFRSG